MVEINEYIKHRDTIKTQIQNQAIDMAKLNPYLLLLWATGTGKSLAALKIMSITWGIKNFYIIVHELNHIYTWENEINKHKNLLPNIQVNYSTYESLHKVPINSYLIVDEVHAITIKRLEELRRINPKKFVGLSASLPEDKRYMLYTWKYNIKEFSISLNQAISLQLLPEPEIHILKYDLDNTTISKDGITDKEKYDVLTKQIQYWLNRTTGNADFMVKKLGLERKKFIQDLKTMYAKSFVDKAIQNNTRFICFTGSIKQCEFLGGDNVVHSQIKNKKSNVNLLNDFNDKKINHLFAVRMLRESMNFVDIEEGYLLQLDSTVKTFIQVAGRCFRNEKPKLFIFVIKDTMDETSYLKKSLHDINKKYITYHDNEHKTEYTES